MQSPPARGRGSAAALRPGPRPRPLGWLLALMGGLSACGLPSTCEEQVWYVDHDGDGYGDPGSARSTCVAPTGGVPLGDDCDDVNPDAHPGAVEVCDPYRVDEDCNGLADDADHDVTGQVRGYADADGDGYGDPSAPLAACDAEDAGVSNAADCDDADATVHPGAPETCGGPDRSCDGVEPPACVTVALADTVYTGPAEGAALSAVALPGDVDGDGHPDVLLGAPGMDPAACTDDARASAAWIYNGMARGHLLVENAERLYQPETSAPAISLVSAPGDVDGDGLADVLLGGPSDGWVVGSASVGSGRAGLIELVSPTWRDDDENGLVLAAAGDVDGDGFGDVLAGHPGHAEVSCWWGGGTRDAAIYTGRAGTLLGSALAGAGDLDGDGADDLVLAANCGGDGCGAGMLYILHGPTSTDAAVDDAADSIVSGLDAGAAVRLRLDAHSARGGDYDGDGRADLLVGVDVRGAATTVGAAYILQDDARHVRSLDEAVAVVARPSRTDLVSSLAWVGDIDGDGATDVAIGSANDETGGLDAGAAWVLTGAQLGAIDPNALPLTILGAGGAGLGVDVAGGVDLDRDGVPELFVGAPGLDPAAEDAGAVYRFSGVTLRDALQAGSR